MKKFKRFVVILVCTLLIFERSVVFSFAQEVETTPTPTPAPTEEPVSQSLVVTATPTATPTETPSEATITDSASVTNNVDSTANTGQNVIVVVTPTSTPMVTPEGLEPTPEVSPTVSLTPTPEPTSLPEESASSTPFSTSSPTPIPQIETGDVLTVANVENEVNTNTVNSEFVNHTLNIYLSDEAHDIDLNLLSQNVIVKVFGQDENFGEVVSVAAYSIDNFAYVENNIAADANTGGNNIEGAQAGEIVTGDAYSAISLLNKVNTNIVNSRVHVVTINIFGSLTGNIILPDSSRPPSEPCCPATLIAENSAIVVNNISSEANSGENTVTALENKAEIITGNAKSVVNVYNLINTNIVNSYFNHFKVNNMGEWAGSFLGWNKSAEELKTEQICDNCNNNLVLGSSAEVINEVASRANTGKNSVSGEEGKIKTGNAFSSTSIINLINTNIINSSGFVGFINIFGRLIGDIGGTEMFPDLSPEPSAEPASEPEPEVAPETQTQNSPQKEAGGKLEVVHKTNVGTHVLPGDTVTFFVKTKNPGTGIVYGTKLTIELLKNGKSYGGAVFNLGDIKPGKAVNLTTGLVLSKNAKGGEYTARVSAAGVVGPDDGQIFASSESKFLLLASTPIVSGVSASENLPPVTTPQILGDTAPTPAFDAYKWLKLYFYLLGSYLVAKSYQKRNEFVLPVVRKVRAFALHLFSL